MQDIDGSPDPISEEALLESWDRDGFILLRNFFDTDKIDRVNQLVDQVWKTRKAPDNQVAIDIHLDSDRPRRILFRDAADDARSSPYKINDLYLDHEQVRDLALDAGLTRILKPLLGGTPLVINSLNFEYGSQQDDHVDTFYMPPKKQNRMLAAWIPLERITLDAGPVHYYPGSHKIPPYLFSHGKTNAISAELPGFYQYMERELAQRNIEKKPLTAEAGDLFIWHAQLLHGGSPILHAQKTRRSLVLHYFRTSEYRHLFWRVRKVHSDGYYYKRPHAPAR